MALFAGLSRQGGRLPDRLEDLHGPWQGIVVLPVHLTWHGLREFDVARTKPRLLLYSIVISQGRQNDLARFVNPSGCATTGRSCACWSAAGCGGPASGSSACAYAESGHLRMPG